MYIIELFLKIKDDIKKGKFKKPKKPKEQTEEKWLYIRLFWCSKNVPLAFPSLVWKHKTGRR